MRLIGAVALFLGCFVSTANAAPLTTLKAEPLALPGSPETIGMDYVAYDPETDRVWVPAGNTGKVDVVEGKTRKVQGLSDFPVAPRGNRTVGPSSASVGQGTVYVGNRADSSICGIDAKSLQKQACVKLESMPDGIAYVATTKEVWITAPSDKALIVLDVTSPTPTVKEKIPLQGQPEGYAVDVGRGIFFTNYEDKDLTLAIDVRTRKIKSQFQPKCGEAGPRGIALDEKTGQLFVACTDKVTVLSSSDGAFLSQVETGAGVDNIDYLPSRKLLYVASGKTAELNIFLAGAKGRLERVATAQTSPGCRVVLVDAKGNAFLPDSAKGRLLVVNSPP